MNREQLEQKTYYVNRLDERTDVSVRIHIPKSFKKLVLDLACAFDAVPWRYSLSQDKEQYTFNLLDGYGFALQYILGWKDGYRYDEILKSYAIESSVWDASGADGLKPYIQIKITGKK